jgi:hypothetical protein
MSSLPQISRRAVANAQSLLKFEKDRPAVYRDAKHDSRDIGFTSPNRLNAITRLLLRATELASSGDEIDAAAKLSLTGLCDWVEAELAQQTESIE